MATYAKVLKDPSGNQILPYTRSKLVYMDDGSTVEDKISNIQNQGGYTLPTASSSTLGGVKIGNNISVNNGTISVGYASYSNSGVVTLSANYDTIPTPIPTNVPAASQVALYNAYNKLKGMITSGSSNMTPDYYNWNMSNVNTSIDNNKFNITNASSRFSSCNMHITMYSRQIAFCTLYLTPKSDITAYSSNDGQQLTLDFSSHGTGSMKKLFPIYNFNENMSANYKQIGCLEAYCENGGTFMRMMNIVLTQALAAGDMMYSSFVLCPF